MDVREIYVIVDGKHFKKSDVVRIILEEGYKHNFLFGENVQGRSEKYIEQADEVWCFGNCEHTLDYNIAKELGSDLWQMG